MPQVIGRVLEGMDAVDTASRAPVDKRQRPRVPVVVKASGRAAGR